MTALTRRPASSGIAAPSANEGLEQVDDLIRRLVSEIVSKCKPVLRPQEECAHEEIIFDTNVDGVRYLLVRMPSPAPPLVPLSPREQEIVRMVAKGYPNKTIASVLEISSWTVASHLRRVFSKLGVSSRAAMVARLLEDGSLADLARGGRPQPILQPRPARSFPAGSAP
jgi:two-component system, NarL family, nitrate/nitrite response regulator NarL